MLWIQTFQEGKESKEEESFLPKDTLEVSMGEDQGISMNLLGEESSPGSENSQKLVQCMGIHKTVYCGNAKGSTLHILLQGSFYI